MRIQEIRKERGIKQKELAAKLGIAANTLSQYETGSREPDIDTTKRIARELNVTIEELVGEQKEKPSGIFAGEREEEFMRLFRALPPEAQERELAYLRERAAGKGK